MKLIRSLILSALFVLALSLPAFSDSGVRYNNMLNTVLAGSVTTSATTIVVANETNFPSIGSGAYTILKVTRMSDLAVEYMKATAINGTTVTVERAQENTSALAFVLNDRVAGVLTKGMIDAIINDYGSSDDTLALAIAAATAAAQTAVENANSALSQIAALLPLDASDIGAGSITATGLATSVAGDGLAGGGGDALEVNVDDSTIGITNDALYVKNRGLTSAKSAYGYLPEGGSLQTSKFMAFEEATSGSTTADGFVFWDGTRPWTVFGNDGNGTLAVYLTFRNTSAAASCNIKVYVGYNLNYYTMTGSITDLGDNIYHIVIPPTGIFGQDGTTSIMFLVPPGYRYMIEHGLNGTTGTRTGSPEMTVHRVHEYR